MNRNMTIPSRPAPPPPQRSAAPPSRYAPITDWDFCAFDSGAGNEASSNRTLTRANQQQQAQHHNVKAKKPPPPRPPPPKLSVAPAAPLKKPGQPQSINILSSLFGQKRSSNGAAANVGKSGGGSALSLTKSGSSAPPVKLLPPPASVGSAKGMSKQHHHLSQWTPPTHNSSSTIGGGHGQQTSSTTTVATAELISFDSPPSSPTFTQKSCSDCISVDSFSSDSNYSSPHNGNMSQAESGFEDDFVSSNRVGSCIPWVEPSFDPFDVGSTSNSRRAPSAPPPGIYASVPLSSSSTAQIRTPLVNSKLQKSDFIDPLCNGRSVLSKVPTVSMPTIIKPPGSASGSQKSTPSHSVSTLASSRGTLQPSAPKPNVAAANGSIQHGLDEDLITGGTSVFDSPPSPPMPCVPPPPPPSFGEYKEEAYGIALYDFEGETMEDLSFKTNEKIYLLSRLNEEWYMGRDRRGLEGMFPVNYVEVKVPLSTEQPQQQDESVPTAKAGTQKVRALYQFTAETADDLTIMEHDMVTVLYQITPEWLYGEINGRRGQFPANYIEYVPKNLQQMPV
ncbi:SH3 domain-containing protein 19 isoform X2 [Anopheles coustani]|uniref:SH3 domain-containing protein 19 isoform X2 n=1 Tax=Anopheles coustani TaxID=139045 RepID=UPI0026595883|nr:SH3 domain-containing protein 19 isoform X2 [Anopheles coustani]